MDGRETIVLRPTTNEDVIGEVKLRCGEPAMLGMTLGGP